MRTSRTNKTNTETQTFEPETPAEETTPEVRQSDRKIWKTPEPCEASLNMQVITHGERAGADPVVHAAFMAMSTALTDWSDNTEKGEGPRFVALNESCQAAEAAFWYAVDAFVGRRIAQALGTGTFDPEVDC